MVLFQFWRFFSQALPYILWYIQLKTLYIINIKILNIFSTVKSLAHNDLCDWLSCYEHVPYYPKYLY